MRIHESIKRVVALSTIAGLLHGSLALATPAAPPTAATEPRMTAPTSGEPVGDATGPVEDAAPAPPSTPTTDVDLILDPELDNDLIAVEVLIQQVVDYRCFGEGDPGDFEVAPRQGPFAEVTPEERPLVDAGKRALEDWIRRYDGAGVYEPSGGGVFECPAEVAFNAANPNRIKAIEEAIALLKRTLTAAKDLSVVLGRVTKSTAVWAYQKSFVAAGKKLALFADFDLRVKLATMGDKLRAVARRKGWTEAKTLAAEHKMVMSFLRGNQRAVAKGALIALVFVGAGWGAKYAWDQIYPPKSVRDANEAIKEMRKLLDEMKQANGDQGDDLKKSVARLNEAAVGYKAILARKDAGADVAADLADFEKTYKPELKFVGSLSKLAAVQTDATQDCEALDRAAKAMTEFLKDRADADEISDADLNAMLDKVFAGVAGDGPTADEVDAALRQVLGEIPDGADK